MLSNSIILSEAIVLDDRGNHKTFEIDRASNKSEAKTLTKLTAKNLKIFLNNAIAKHITYGEIVWRNVLIFILLHLSAVYGIYLLISGKFTFFTFAIGMWINKYCVN